MPLPDSFIQSLKDAPGFEEAAFRLIHDSGEQVTSVRLNPLRNFILPSMGIEMIPWSSNGYYLQQRPSFTLDPAFHAGAYYVQEASSMFLEHALSTTCDLSAQLNVLDLCAAPGGKSTLIQSLISRNSVLVSNEMNKQRAGILEQNMTRWGSANVIVTNNQPSDFTHLKGIFDVVVIDAPCSGSGLFRKDTAAINEWSLNNVEMCSRRQRLIIDDVLPCLKENGILIYATCSYSLKEDEEITTWLVQKGEFESLPLFPPAEWNIIETQNENTYGYRFYPDKLKGEGFFLSAFRKTAPAEVHRIKDKRKATSDVPEVKSWLNPSFDYSFLKHKDSVIALTETTASILNTLEGVYILKAGVNLGMLSRKELIPDHPLALSAIISSDIPSLDLDLEESLQYLRRADFGKVSDMKGWALVKFNELNLGWVKLLGNRINNYYPKEWRILNM